VISKRILARSIDKAHEQLDSVWRVLFQLNSSLQKDHGQQLIECQSKLIEALWILDAQYRAVSSEKKRLIDKKNSYVATWFARRMAQLDTYLKILTGEIGSAKVIGDGYAWIFYRTDEHLIDEHLKRQRQINLPPGVGGIGERAFVEKLQGWNRQFVLYHGITSYLRLGDVTFFDPVTRRVKSIGELKSQQIGKNEYRITLGFIYGSSVEPPIDLATLSSEAEDNKSGLSKAFLSRLHRQLDEIRSAVAKAKESESHTALKTNGEYYFKELDQVIEESSTTGFAYRKAGKSLVLGAIRIDGKRASERALGKLGKLEKKLDPALSAARSIMDPSLNDNCMFVGTVGYGSDGFPTVLPGTLPLVWWPISKKSLYDLVFGRVIILSIYNPAHFWGVATIQGLCGDHRQSVPIYECHQKTS
jgi:hypothetical protein